MAFLKPHYPLVQLPSRMELLLFLIKEDIKSRKFFNGLRELGLDDAWYGSELSTLIIAYAGLDSESDAHTDFYYHLTCRHLQFQNDRESLMQSAVNVYTELMAWKEKTTLKGK